ncbi:hypothetical protein V2J09_010033 [Rumex salicifolius]
MAVLHQPIAIPPTYTPKPCRLLPTISPNLIPHCTRNPRTHQIPAIDLSKPGSGPLLVKACEELGFFKVTNHGVPAEIVSPLEDLAVKFFSLPLHDKERAGSSSPLGYGNKRIGLNGDVGWLEYLLLSSSPEFISKLSDSVFPDNPEIFSNVVKNYMSAVKKMACQVLEAIAEELRMDRNDVFSSLLKDENSDSCFRVNHYPPYPSEVEANLDSSGERLMGFGEHTDPQIISVLRSNDISGLEILTKDGNWVSVPPDNKSYYIIVGDSFQVMTNGRFRSVKHRAVAEGNKSRISMVYFGGPPPGEKIAPLPTLMGKGERSLYKEFTWWEFKKTVYKSRLSDNRLGPFEKKAD